MTTTRRAPPAGQARWRSLLVVVGVCLIAFPLSAAQGLTGALIGTFEDAQGGGVPVPR